MTTNGHTGGFAGAMVAAPGLAKTEPMGFTAEQRSMIRDTFANGASESEFAVLLEVASARRLNPLLRQIHFVKRYDSQRRRDVWSTQAAIDGLRAIAQRTGMYGGQDEPEFVEKDGRLVACKVRVYRKDWQRPSVGVAYWNEYVQVTREGAPTRFWQQMPHVMLAKCAEALALRKAFPEDMSGLYVPEEMAQAENPVLIEQAASERSALPAPPPNLALFAQLCDRVDAAESAAELNAIARDASKALKSGHVTESHIEQIKTAVTRKRELIGKPPPPPEPSNINLDSSEGDSQ